MRVWQKILLSVILAAGLFAAANFEFFWKNARYRELEVAFVPHEENPVATATRESVLSIPSLGITAPVVYIDEKGEDAFQTALKDGVVHYPKTAMPGAFGNCYIFGHSSDYFWSSGKYKTVFALLPKIKAGDTIDVSYQGQIYTYTVTQTKVVNTNEVKYLDQSDKSKKILTLQTSYPVGTALRRFLAIAELKM